jgi:hypothetical protein
MRIWVALAAAKFHFFVAGKSIFNGIFSRYNVKWVWYVSLLRWRQLRTVTYSVRMAAR